MIKNKMYKLTLTPCQKNNHFKSFENIKVHVNQICFTNDFFPTKHHICTANWSMEKTNLGIDYAFIF